MKRSNNYLLILALLIVCTVVSVIISLYPSDDKETQEPSLIETPSKLYTQAISGLFPDKDVRMVISQKTVTCIDNQQYEERSNRTISYDLSDSADYRYQILEEMIIASHTVAIEEIYISGNHYFTISDTFFRTQCNEDSFLAQVPSIIMLDPNLYKSITGVDTGDVYLIQFDDATAVEKWVSTDSPVLQQATGTATLSKDNQLQKYTYTVSYQQDTVKYEVSYEATLEYLPIDITPPEDTASFLPLSNPENIKILERAVGFLLQSQHISSVYQERIYFEALGDHRNRLISLSVDTTNPLTATVNTEITLANDSRIDQNDKSVTEEKFAQGQYTKSINGHPPITDIRIDSDAMQQYIQNQLISTIMLPAYISSCDVKEGGSVLRLEFGGTTAYAEFLCQNAGQQLYQNPNLLQAEGTEVRTNHLTCYLEVDAMLGLPLSSGISYSGSYENEGLPYRFTYDAVQTYKYSNT